MLTNVLWVLMAATAAYLGYHLVRRRRAGAALPVEERPQPNIIHINVPVRPASAQPVPEATGKDATVRPADVVPVARQRWWEETIIAPQSLRRGRSIPPEQTKLIDLGFGA